MVRILIIDDEKWVVRSLRALMKDSPCFEIVGEAYNGLQGWTLIEEEKPDLVFVDIRMPGMGGLQLLQKAREEKLSTLFAVISGYAEFAYAQKAMANGAIAYCLKPFSQSEINETLEKARSILEERAQVPAAVPPSAASKMPPEIPPVKNELVRQMLIYISAHLCCDICMQQVADACSINPNYASQIFGREVGESFSAYISRQRIRLASELLLTTQKPIAQIAEETGYRDYFYFAKVFKKLTGLTPTAFRGREEAASENTEVLP